MPDFEKMAADVVAAAQGFVARSVAGLARRIDAVEKRFSEIPPAKDGEPGKDADPVDYKAIELMVSEAVSAIPPPKDGKDADPVNPEIVATMVRDAVAAMPRPADGKDADPELVRYAAAEAVSAIDFVTLSDCSVARAVERLPRPKDGDPGKSVTVDDVRPLIADEVAKAAALIPAPKDGESVPLEQVQRMVDDAVSKATAAIRVPKDGEPGRDAAHLEILSAIDGAKSYPRGTYAKHANGFWRAFERTDGMRGWECLVAGLAAVSVTRAHEREYTHTFTLSDGTVVEHKESIPVAIYRGVFVEGRAYEPGDQVSWGAHQWHCNETTTEKPADLTKAWTLSVKRGRDGKPGLDGKDFTPPKPVKLDGSK